MAATGCHSRISRLLGTRWDKGDNARMEPSPQLEAFFDLCKDIYKRRVREGTWPWPIDSTLSEDMIDSESSQSGL